MRNTRPPGKTPWPPAALLLCFIRFRRFLAMSNRLRRQLWVWALAACLPLFAQEFRAGITGIVKDSQGAVVPAVPIEAHNVTTNDVFRATTNEAGVSAFPVLAIGNYRLTVSAPGFKKAVRDNLELRVGDQVQQDFALELGMVSEQVTVSAGVETVTCSLT